MTQIRVLLAAVRGLSGRGQHLEAFFGCLYYAALRPSEAAQVAAAFGLVPVLHGLVVVPAPGGESSCSREVRADEPAM